MNKVILIGRLTRDPDVRYTQGEKPMCVARYTLAVDRTGKKQEGETNADFPTCVAFGKAGEFVEKYCKKATKLAITGRLQTGSYTNKDGVKVYTTDVVIETQEFVESKNGSQGNTQQSNQEQSPRNEAAGLDGFMNIPDGIDEQLPFA